MFATHFTRLSLTCLSPREHQRTSGGEWFTVRHSVWPHTAFRTAEQVHEWLSERGLSLAGSIPGERGTFRTIGIVGEYFTAIHRDVDAFQALETMHMIAVKSNGEYTLGMVTEDETGVRTVHYMNPDDRAGLFPWPSSNDRSFRQEVASVDEQRKDVQAYIQRQLRRASGYAAKFAAETVSAEPPRWEAPTDDAFATRFARCAKVPGHPLYPLIRALFEHTYAETIAAARTAATD